MIVNLLSNREQLIARLETEKSSLLSDYDKLRARDLSTANTAREIRQINQELLMANEMPN